MSKSKSSGIVIQQSSKKTRVSLRHSPRDPGVLIRDSRGNHTIFTRHYFREDELNPA